MTNNNRNLPVPYKPTEPETARPQTWMPPPKRLRSMLTYKRKSGSNTEEQFIVRFIKTLTPAPEQDGYGNYWVTVPNKDGTQSPILWSTHTDTVHHEGGIQELKYEHGFLSLQRGKAGQCLGADDGAGLWVATEMVRKGVPGTYVFHRDEESGGGGSIYVASQEADRLRQFKFAIALDRKGYGDVITHQFGRCCSDEFAKQLAGLLGGSFKPDETGMFTDTANYVDIIPECTNLSIGYFDNHGPKERLNVPFIVWLRNKMVSTDFSVLEAVRDPKAKITYPKAWKSQSMDDYWDRGRPDRQHYNGPSHRISSYTDYRDYTPLSSFERFVKDHPEFVASYLMELGFDEQDIKEAYWDEVLGPRR